MRAKLITAVCVSAVLFSGCIDFESIDQPFSISINQVFTVHIETHTTGGDFSPYFGICIPMGWSVPGDSVPCTGVYNETIFYDSLVSSAQETASPAPVGYYWWAGSGSTGDTLEGNVYGELQIQTDDQLGCFSLDYMLGNSYYGVNEERSNDHLIWVVDEYTPIAFHAIEGYNSVMMNWRPPAHSGGLLGYNIYRDQQVINTGPIIDTTYNDDNALAGAHRYAVSSLYYNGSEHLIPYEIIVVYGEYLYVSPDGDNSNDGSSFENALLTITYALSIIRPDSLHPKTILLNPGVYSPTTNGEQYPISFTSYVSLIGAGTLSTILDADNQGGVIEFESVDDVSIEALAVTNGSGRGIFCDHADPVIVDVSIGSNNGGVFCEYANPYLENVMIDGNHSSVPGGGISCHWSSPSLLNVTINGNTADYGGGGIFCYSSDPRLENVWINGNTADYGGGIYCDGGSSPILSNVIIIRNSAIRGGGIHSNGSSPNLLNVIISDNTAEYGAGGIYCDGGSSLDVLNCILWNDAPQEIYILSGSVDVTYSCIQGGWPGEGNISVDPLFRDPENGDFCLQSITNPDCGGPGDSPCIDAGDPNILDSLLDCSWGLGGLRSDMGAYGGGDSGTVGIVDTPLLPGKLILMQNYPNPFNVQTTIRFLLPEPQDVHLTVYDLLGRQIRTLLDERKQAGVHTITVDASPLSSGVYFYRLQAGDKVDTKRMVLLK